MADTMQFDLVSPERRLASLAVTEVQIPGAAGDMTAMPDHAPVITTLRPGVLRVVGPEGTKDFAVTGGFAEVTAKATTVLAERALPLDEVSAAFMDELIADAERIAAAAGPETRSAADKAVADLRALRTAAGR